MRLRFKACWPILAILVAIPLTSSAALVNHFTMDSVDTDGLVLTDTAGSFANNATWVDAATTAEFAFDQAGIIGEAVSFTGNSGDNNFFAILNGPGASMEIAGATALTYSFWMKPDFTQTNASGVFYGRGSTVERNGGDGTDVGNQVWGTSIEGTTQTDINLRSDSTGTIRSPDLYDGAESEPEWFHVVRTWSGSGMAGSDDPIKLYVNGQLVDEAMVNADIYKSGTWVIGADTFSNNRNYAGLLDDLAVWDTELTPTDIDAIYQAGLTGIDAETALTGDVTPGDVTGEGIVNGADFEIIRQNFFTAQTERNQGDIVDNDFVDFRDYGQWKQAPKTTGALAAVASAQVPEPSTTAMLLGAIVLGAGIRRASR